jgi:class 3 adenylate cyclase
MDSSRIDRQFGRWIRIGRLPSMPQAEARYVVLTNIIALLGVGFTLAFAPLLFAAGSGVYAGLQLVYAALYLPTLWLNRRRHHVAATTWLVLSSHLAVVSQVLVEGTGFDVQLFFMLHAILPFMVFPPRHNKAMFALSALAGADLIAVIVFGPSLPQLGPVISEAHLAWLRPTLIGGLFFTIAACANYARRATLIAEEALDKAHARSESLLLNILPPAIANRLKAQTGTIADGFAGVTVLFADIVGFTKMSARLPPERVVEMLDDLFCTFDDHADRLGLEKIKTIGDCYMIVGGLPELRADHADAVAEMALVMIEVVHAAGAQIGEPIDVRIGMHSGPVVAGVIGKRKFTYDVWGDTVNVASRMESHGVPGQIQLTSSTQKVLAGKFQMTRRGMIEVKGKGEMETWFLDKRLSVPSAQSG